MAARKSSNLKQLMISRGLPNQEDEIRNILILVCEAQREKFQDLEDDDIQKVLSVHNAQLNEDYLEQLTVLSEPEDAEDSAAAVEASTDYKHSEERPLDGR
jgi:hypothetical protein